MKELSIYLAGACKNEVDGGKGFREEITKKLLVLAEWSGKKIRIFDPTKKFGYSEKKHKTEKQIKEYFLDQLSKCDIVLVNCNETDSSCGTCMEIQFAKDHGIPCIGYGTTNIYPWVLVDCQVVFDELTEALDYIREYYMMEV